MRDGVLRRLTRIVKDGADPKAEIATMKTTIDAELKRVNG